MLATAQVDQAAHHLLAARRARQPGPRLPESCRPTEIEDALAIQQRVQELLGVAVGGWKCSLPTPERALAYAAIFAPTIARASPCPVADRGRALRIEPEIAFVLGRDLPPRVTAYSDAEITSAIAEVRLALEVLGSRYADPGAVTFPEILADQVSNQGLFVGPVLHDALAQALEGFPIAVDGPEGPLHRRDGRHPDEHPLRPFLWLANFLATRAEVGGLKAGQIVTTGSYAGALEVPAANSLSVRFGDLGTIRVKFVAA
ncbi:MAG TPA: 2-keto-4-pentenoate hydratase [Casimicrobiaceae bacterium]